MKINVTCGCGHGFEAPAQLAGQVVRCPACRKPVTVPAAASPSRPTPYTPQAQAPRPPQAPPPEAEVDLSDLTSLDQNAMEGSTLQGSTAGRSSIRSAPKKPSRRQRAASESTSSDQAITQELDDRMTRLYEVYAGKEMRFGGGSGGKMKLLIGLGIAVVTIGVGIFVGLHVLKTEYGVTSESVSSMLAGQTGQTGDAGAAPQMVERKQSVDENAAWQESVVSANSGVALKGVEIVADRPDALRYGFKVSVVPASAANDRRLSMATSVALYRSLDEQGPYTQVDRTQVAGFDRATGALSFELFDEVSASVSTNRLYYRLTGFDSDSRRLFDTPAAGFARVPKPTLTRGRVAWPVASDGSDLPGMRIQARIDAPGWEDVLLWRVAVEGAGEQAVPELPSGLPVVVESAVHTPTGIAIDGNGVGRWRMRWVGEVLEKKGAVGTAVAGVLPYASGGGLDYKMVPDEQAFSAIDLSATSAGVTTISFVPQGEREQTLSIASLPTPTNVTTTAYDGRVRLGWDSSALVAGLKRYDGPVGIVIRRVDPSGAVRVLAQLPVDSTGYTDTDVANGAAVSYEVSLVSEGVSASDPLVSAEAWVSGHGAMPVLVPCDPVFTTARVTPGEGLNRLFVSLGVNELSYDGTGMAALRLQGKLVELLTNTPGVSVVDRAALRSFVQTGTGGALAGPMRGVAGMPAQVQLRLVDSTGPGGDGLSLWATDLAAGQARLLAQSGTAKADEQVDLFVTALRTYLESRLPESPAEALPGEETPKLVVIGPIIPVDQPVLYYRADEVADRLAQAGDQAGGDTAVVTRSFWIKDTRQDLQKIDPGTMSGAVLVVGRVWTGTGAMPGVSLDAIDAVGGRLIDRFTAEELNPEAVRAFAQWCGALRLPSEPVPAGDSPLLAMESSITPIHPIWRQASNGAAAPSGSAYPGTGVTANAGATPLSFGLPLPAALGGLRDISTREPDHPLYAVRPHVAPKFPLTFDEWVKAYAEYIEADCAAFVEGFEQVRRIQQAKPGPIYPDLIIRGERKLTSGEPIPASAGGLRITPAALSVHTFFPMGASGQPMIDYRSGLSEMFRARPWAMSHAWKLVGPVTADPFLKAELYGVEDGRYSRLTLPDKPAPFYMFIAADLLTDIGNREGHNFRQRAIERASSALSVMINLSGQQVTQEDKRLATDAILVLIFVKDPGAIEKMSDSGFRQMFFSVPPAMQTDVLRMLVDRIGPKAWEWAGEFDSVDWPTFCWRSADEMDWATRDTTGLVPEDTRLSLRSWLDQREVGPDDAPDVITATGPADGARPN
jgi:hypothetical protein